MKVLAPVAETGIDSDYYNEYWFRTENFIYDGLSGVAADFKRSPVKKYEERYSPTIYENVVTEQNQARVKRLNELSDLVNNTFIDVARFTEADFKRVMNEVHDLIYGQGLDCCYPEEPAVSHI